MKSAITVIDQELIDDAKSTIKPDDEACERAKISVGTLKDLILMCEDLIEINAELTKREQHYKSGLKILREVYPTPAIINYVDDLLKGDSDE